MEGELRLKILKSRLLIYTFCLETGLLIYY